MRTFWRHPLTVAVCNILLVMAIYSAMRIFCFAVNGAMFPNVSGAHLWEMMAGGMRFDLTAVLYLSSLYIIGVLLPLPAVWRENKVYQQVLKWLFLNQMIARNGTRNWPTGLMKKEKRNEIH